MNTRSWGAVAGRCQPTPQGKPGSGLTARRHVPLCEAWGKVARSQLGYTLCARSTHSAVTGGGSGQADWYGRAMCGASSAVYGAAPARAMMSRSAAPSMTSACSSPSATVCRQPSFFSRRSWGGGAVELEAGWGETGKLDRRIVALKSTWMDFDKPHCHHPGAFFYESGLTMLLTGLF